MAAGTARAKALRPQVLGVVMLEEQQELHRRWGPGVWAAHVGTHGLQVVQGPHPEAWGLGPSQFQQQPWLDFQKRTFRQAAPPPQLAGPLLSCLGQLSSGSFGKMSLCTLQRPQCPDPLRSSLRPLTA